MSERILPHRDRPPTRFERAMERLASTKPGTWAIIHLANPIDRRLLQRSHGRRSLFGGFTPTLLLEHVGARTGTRRQTPLTYTPDGDRYVLIASKGGAPEHPAWYHNLRAHPEVDVLVGGARVPVIAREAEGEERERLWRRANELYAGYDGYQQRTGGRRIPVMVLEPRDQSEPDPEVPDA